MEKKETKADHEQEKNPAESHGISLPGFVNDDDVGLGDVIKRATSALGIPACGGCQRRAAALNRWLTFSGKSSK